MKVAAAFEPAIVAREMEPMLAFYRDTLGMREFSRVELSAAQSRQAGLSDSGYAMVRLDTEGGDRLKIAVPKTPPAAAEPAQQLLGKQGFAYLTFIVPDVRAVIGALQAKGYTVRTGGEPVAFRPGVVELAIAQDPEGNCVEFVQRNDLDTYRPTAGKEHA